MKLYEDIRALLAEYRIKHYGTPNAILLNPDDEYKLFKYLNPRIDVGVFDDEAYYNPKLISNLFGIPVYRSHDIPKTKPTMI